MGTFKNPGGRPSKFKKRYIKDMIEFFDIEPTRKELMKTTTKNGNEISNEYKLVANRFPTIVKFAKSIDVGYTTVYDWAHSGTDSYLANKLKTNAGITAAQVKQLAYLAEFSDAYKTCKSQQQDFLMDNGLIGASPASAFIFTAKNVTKMRDKVENDIKVTEVKPLLDNLRNRAKDKEDEHST